MQRKAKEVVKKVEKKMFLTLMIQRIDDLHIQDNQIVLPLWYTFLF